MPIRIIPESLNGYSEPPSKRLSGSYMADFYLLVEIENVGSKSITLERDDIHIIIKNGQGKLLLVERASWIVGRSKLILAPNSRKSMKIQFTVPGDLLLEIPRSTHNFSLEIESDTLTMSKDISLFTSLPEANDEIE